MINVQVAIQGGGAKLICLLAVLEALHGAEESRAIRIVRFAGTSAGAISAALYSKGHTLPRARGESDEAHRTRSLSAVGELLRKTKTALHGDRGRKLRKDFRTPGRTKALWRCWWGKPLWKSDELEAWFAEEFGSVTFGQLDIPVKVISASLGESATKPYGNDDSVRLALLESAGLPFFLRTFSATGDVYVDGGICENLPSAHLAPDLPILVISFREKPGKSPRNLAAFGKALLNTAIDNSVRRAKNGIADLSHLHEIDTDLDTFDFNRAFDPAFGDSYNLAFARARDFIDNFVDQQKSRDQYLNPLYWTDGNPRLKKALERIGDIYKLHDQGVRIRVHECRFEVIATSLIGPGILSKTICWCKFSALDQPVHASVTSFTGADLSGLLAETSWEVVDENKKPIRVVHVPLVESRHPDRRAVLLYYDPPLMTGKGNYIERITDRAVLRPEDLTTLEYTPAKAKGPIGRFELVLHVPNERPGVRLVARKDIPDVFKGKEMPWERVHELREHREDLKDCYTVGWSCEEIEFPEGVAFGVNIVAPLA